MGRDCQCLALIPPEADRNHLVAFMFAAWRAASGALQAPRGLRLNHSAALLCLEF